MSDADGRLLCGVRRFIAVPVALHDGKLTEARIVNDVPLVVLCRSCDRPWEQSQCLELAQFLEAQLTPAPRGLYICSTHSG